jgi:ABC-type enterobactin transport system permease subunit
VFAVGSEGGVFYAMSNSHVEFEVSSGGGGGIIDWLTNSFLGVPNFIFVSAGGAAAAVVVVLLVKKKK